MAGRMALGDATTSIAATITPPPTGIVEAIRSSFTNSTSTYFSVPPAKDLVLVPLRLAYRVERYLLGTFPQQITRTLGIDTLAQNIIDNIGLGEAGEAAADQFVGAAAGQVGDTWGGALQEILGFHNVRSFGGMLNYLTSRWSFACFSMALILNRVTVYAASRQRILLTWDKRLAIRIVPILLLASQIHSLLQGIRCQTSPDWSLHRYGKAGKHPALDWSSNGGGLYQISSNLLFWEDDSMSCSAVEMSKPLTNSTAPYGSFSLLWPTFLRLCLSHFVETVSCALQQRPVMTETGMSLFEHSLAFAEAEAMVGHSMGLSIFGSPKPGTSAANRTAEVIKDAGIETAFLARPFVLDRVNVPAEVLLIALISSCNSLTSNVIAVFNKQQKWRLINTGIWGVCFMTAFVWGFINTASTSGHGDLSSGFLRFPTVCIVGFIPHLLILMGMGICMSIYLLALSLTAMSLSTNPALGRPTSLRERLLIAHENLQATIQMKGFEIRWYEDLYTALLRIGFAVLTAASEAVFLNEGRSVEVRRYTWLEEERLDELESSTGARRPNAAYYHIQEEYGRPPGVNESFVSGYGKERKIEDPKNKPRGEAVHMQPGPNGVGALQRSTRFWLLFIFIKGIFFLVISWMVFGIGSALDYIGITARPRWLRKIAGKSMKRAVLEQERTRESRAHDYALDFWLMDDGGDLTMPRNDALDIEPEMRRIIMRQKVEDSRRIDQKLDRKLYHWWKMGGWWGTEDNSGDFEPAVNDDNEDTTSVISMSTNASSSTDITTTTNNEYAWENLSSGQVTPTQDDFTRETTPFPESDLQPLDAPSLSRLLNPTDAASRSEARIMSSHLSAPEHHIVTRSQFRRELEQERSRVLLSGRHRLPGIKITSIATSSGSPDMRMTSEEESEILEKMIIDRRNRRQNKSDYGQDDHAHSAPLCVVCQSTPRSVITWPCRCLCVCEDCRVSLAMNNFGSCVTCRREVVGFVRMWVP